MIWLSIALGISYWVGDAVVESAVYHQGTFLSQVLSPQDCCRVERPTVAALLVAFGLTAEVFRRRARGRVEDLMAVSREREERALRDEESHRLMENLILSAKTEWEETFNSIDEAITVHDANFTIVSANRAAEELFSLPLQSLLGQKCCAIYHGLDAPPANCASCSVSTTGKAVAVSLFEPHLGRHIEITATPRSGGSGGVIHIVRDVTERLRVEEEQRRLETHLQESQKIESIGRLAGGVAHDFNNILSVILGYCQLALLRLPAESPVRPSIAQIKDSADRAAALTGQLLAFSRRQVLQVKLLDLNTVVAGVSQLLQRLIGEDVVLVILPGAEPVPAVADRNQVEQILMNLAVNARDAMPGGGRLVIESSLATVPPEGLAHSPGITPGRYALLTVRDNGCGMSDEVRGRIFEPFFTTKAPGSGTGLGLATVYGIVKQHRGYIYADSAPGQGTTFRVYLSEAGKEAPEAPSPVADASPRGSGTVLVVDDDPVLRHLVCETLCTLGYTALEAADAEEAVRAFASHPGRIDLLLTDVVMPGMNGRDLAERLRAIAPGLRVLFISGYTDDIIARHGVLEPGLHYLPKPFGPSTLGAKVREVLSGAP